MQTQTSNTLHNAIMEAGSKDRPPMLAPDKEVAISKGSLVTRTESYMDTYKTVSQDIRDQLNDEAEAVQIILTGIDNDIYSTVDACSNACEMWKAIERLKQGESINVQDLETNLYWEFGKFTSQDGESLESYYSRFYKMMNELIRNQCDVTNHQVNVQFLLPLQPEWQSFVTLVKQSQELKTVSYHKLYDILKQHQNEVNEIRAKKIARVANPLALVAQQQPVYNPQTHPTHYTQNSSTRLQQAATRNRGKAIVNSPTPIYDQEPSMVAEDAKMSKDKEIDKLMALISLSFKKIYKPTNNNLRTSSNTSRANQDNSPRINRCTGYENQRIGNVAGARETVAYHREKMLLCKEEAGIQLNAEQADWRDDTDDESNDQELEARYMYMAQLQEVSPDATDSGPIFDTEPIDPNDDDADLVNERELLASLIEKLKCEIDESKNRNKFLETSNKVLIEKLKGEIKDFKNKNKSLESSNNHFKEANNKLSETNNLLYADFKKSQAELARCSDVEYASKKEAQIKLYKTREDKELDKVIALENKVKVLDNIVYKTGQSVQTMNMLNNKCRTSFAKPEFLKKAQRVNPHLYDIGCYNDNLALMLAPESDEVIRLEKESRSKLSELIRPFNYDKLNNLFDLFTLGSQLETQKTQFLNEIDRLSREYYYADHMNAILGVYTELDEVTNLQCDYLELLDKCDCLEKELSKSKMMSKSFEALQKHAINLEIDLQQYLKAQLQDKGIVISELKKLIEKLKGKSVDTKFEKSSVIRQPNAFKSQRPSVLGKPTIFSNSFERKDFSSQRMYKLHTESNQARISQLPQDSRKTNKRMSFSIGVIPTTSVTRPQLKINPMGDSVMYNNSQGKKQDVEDHHRSVKFSKNKTSVTACNDNLNAKTLNVNFMCATCDKCVLNDKHDMCVLNSVPKPLKKIVASESNQKPKNITRKLYEHVSKACSWWYPKFTPSGYKWKPKSDKENLVEIVLFIIDSGCSKHMTGNLKLLINFMEKFLGTVKFGDDQIAHILGYGDLVQGAVTIKRVYYVEGLNHNLFSVGQFCDADLEVAFRKSTCYIRDLKGNDLLTGSRGSDFMVMALSSLSLNFDTINLLSKNNIVVDLPKLKFVKDHLCSSCELGKAKRKSFHTKLTPSSKRRLQLLHMDLCGPMRVASINGKRYVLVIIDDYSRYIWTHFLRSKDETPKVLIDFLRLVQRGLQAQVRIVRTNKGTEFLNQTLHAYFAAEGNLHQTSVARTPEQNDVVERQNRTLVEATRTILSAAKVPLFFWAEAIATTYGENLDKMKEKGDACIFVGYSTQSRAYRVFNKRTRVIVETIHVNFDELPQMASDHVSSDPAPECQRMALEHDSLSPDLQCQENSTQADRTVTTSIELDLLFSLMFDELLNGSPRVVSKSSAVSTADALNQRL
uniref:Integrase catalytic domain-containing protein n=1 Tax=Tanacetum cinerariifolium TaxID=118510 RepID=A0A6L2K8B0_TANCI|nr:hypothetical protein [Tanacetum cinerariifolium]